MDTSSFDTKIQHLESDVVQYRERMESLSLTFIDVVKSSTVEWAKEKVQGSVSNHPEVITKLGKDGVRKLKDELEALYSELPQWVETRLSQSVFWPHRLDHVPSKKQEDERSEWIYRDRLLYAAGTLAAVQDVLSKLGQLLYKYNLYPLYSGTPDFKYFARANPGYKFPETVLAVAKEYALLCENQFLPATIQLENLKREKLQAEAQDLWDNA